MSKESTFGNMLVTLVVVTGVAAVSLGFVYKLTKEPIATAKAEKQMRAIQAVVGQYDNDPLTDSYQVCKGQQHQHRFRKRAQCKEHDLSTEVETLTFYPASLQTAPTATAIQTYSDKGYGGRIELMVGIDKDGVIKNIEVVSHAETPGLGSKIRDEEFVKQFLGRKVTAAPLQVKKDGGDVDAISGATISSRAFCEAVQQAINAWIQTKEAADTSDTN